MSVETISPSRLEEIRKSGGRFDLIDVRTPVEFREIHAESARNVPLDQLDTQTMQRVRNGAADEPLYLICRSGKRAATACQKFIDAGYANVVTIEGGTEAWEAVGLPVVRGKKAMSLERQVRIAAGSLVLLGIVLGWLVHPYLLGISAFVGAGLVFAGITDTCGIGMLLAKMPWNQVREEQPSPPDSSDCETEENRTTEFCCG
jgi:rhodanese-related sulfurtransferase